MNPTGEESIESDGGSDFMGEGGGMSMEAEGGRRVSPFPQSDEAST